MKHFLHKKWLSIPLIVVLVLAITAGGVFAAYTFLGFTTVVTVEEPLTIEMAWYDYTQGDALTDYWLVDGSGDELTLDMSPAETQKLAVRISNDSYGALTVDTLFAGWGVDQGYFTFSGWPNGSIPGSDDDPLTYEFEGDVTISLSGDAPAGVYDINVAFTRK